MGDEEYVSKVERMKQLLIKKKECDRIAKDIVLNLIEPKVDKNYLLEKAALITTSHWDDIVEERKLTGICGWVLCHEKLSEAPKQRYIIRNNKVIDITDRKNYCSSYCYGFSEHFKRQIPQSPLWLRDEEPTPEFKLVDESEKLEVKLEGITIKFDAVNLSDSDSSSEEDGDAHADVKDEN